MTRILREARSHTAPMLFKIVLCAWFFSAFVNWSVEHNLRGLLTILPSSVILADVDIQIPDHVFGEDVDVVLTRDPFGPFIKRDLPGRFQTDVIRLDVGAGAEVCRPSGTPTYQDRPGQNIWTGPISSFLAGCPHPLPPGQYLVQTWRWGVFGGFEVPLERVDARFTISP